MVYLIVRGFSTTYFIFFPAQSFKKTYFISCVVQVFSLGLISSAHVFPEHHKYLLLLGMAGLGAGKGTLSLVCLTIADNLR